MSLELVIVGDEAWTRAEWEAEQDRIAKSRTRRRSYRARPDVKERTKQYDRVHRMERRAYNREWMARYRSSRSSRLVGSLHDLACFGPTRDTGCVCNKIRFYDQPR